MSSRQRNMLEAFKHAGEALPPDQPSSAGPFAGPRREPEAEQPVEVDVPSATWEQVLEELPPWVPKALGAALLFGLGILVGRASVGGEVRAEVSDPPPTSSAGLGAEGDLRDDPSRILPGDREIADPAGDPLYALGNEYTIVLATYDNTKNGLAAAWATYDWLADLAYDVFPPAKHVADENDLVILAGAAPQSADLEDLLQKLRAETEKNRPDRLPFESAYIARIDNQIERYRDQ